MTRDDAIELARACAKAKPQSYYAEPFHPHEWVIDAIMTAGGIASGELKVPTAPAASTIDRLQKLLEAEEDVALEILPNGEIRTKDGQAPGVKPLTMRENLGGEYAR